VISGFPLPTKGATAPTTFLKREEEKRELRAV
jgi:hypothetical protein